MVFGRVTEGLAVVKQVEALGSRSGRTAKRIVIADCGELPSRRQILAKLRAEKAEAAALRQGPQYVDPDAESLQRLKRLKGEAGGGAPLAAAGAGGVSGRTAIPVKTAQDELRELEERQAAEQAAQQAAAAPAAQATAAAAREEEEEPEGAGAGAGQPSDASAAEGGEGGGALAYPHGGGDPTAGMNPRQRKLYELQQRMRQARKANETAVVAEKRRQQSGRGMQEGTGSDGSKRKWYEEQAKQKVGGRRRAQAAGSRSCGGPAGSTASSLAFGLCVWLNLRVARLMRLVLVLLPLMLQLRACTVCPAPRHLPAAHLLPCVPMCRRRS